MCMRETNLTQLFDVFVNGYECEGSFTETMTHFNALFNLKTLNYKKQIGTILFESV